jgi:transcription antitermination factor NusG
MVAMASHESLAPVRPTAVTLASAPQTPSLPVCGSLPAEGWLVVGLTSEWVGTEPRACREIRRTAHEFQVFLPRVRILVAQPHQPPARRTIPAFPGYLFVLPPAPRAWHRLRSMPGVASVLNVAGRPGTPYRMPPALMDRLMARASKLGVLEDASVPEAPPRMPLLDAGTRCRVIAGCLEGQAGAVDQCKPYAVRLLLAGLGIPVWIRRDQVEVVETDAE